MGRILAIDYGSKRIGLAVSDETKTISSLLPFVRVEDKDQLLGIIKEREIDLLLMGLPKNLQGLETQSAASARELGEWLKNETNLQVVYIDERFSTKQATHKLHEKNLKGQKARAEIDSLAAQTMLESYLENKK